MSRKELWLRRKALYDQIHYTVIYEDEILLEISISELYAFRDHILDEIIFVERQLGIRK